MPGPSQGKKRNRQRHIKQGPPKFPRTFSLSSAVKELFYHDDLRFCSAEDEGDYHEGLPSLASLWAWEKKVNCVCLSVTGWPVEGSLKNPGQETQVWLAFPWVPGMLFWAGTSALRQTWSHCVQLNAMFKLDDLIIPMHAVFIPLDNCNNRYLLLNHSFDTTKPCCGKRKMIHRFVMVEQKHYIPHFADSCPETPGGTTVERCTESWCLLVALPQKEPTSRRSSSTGVRGIQSDL